MNRRSQSGVSLIEMVVAILVILIMTAIAKAPMSQYLKTMEQKNAVVGVRKILQTARSRAMANPSVHCGVYFDLNASPPKAFLFEDTFAPGSYAYDAGKDKPYLAPFVLPMGASLAIPVIFPAAVIYRGDGSAFLSGKLIVRSPGFTDTVDVLASTGRIRSTR
ncbi:MAG: hypothetical protein JWO30_2124 [Fibrobacteres bacterium]|nr:hypothetical protein [Fibrobacterota bacterium]